MSLRLYPIKSCRGFTVNKSTLRTHGLDLDRQWMFVDAQTLQFLTIRQIPDMTLINRGLSEDGKSLLLSISSASADAATTEKPISIPARPDKDWLEQHTTLS